MFPRWLSWLFIIFLGYIIVTGNRGVTTRDGEPQKAARQEHIAQSYPEMHALIDGDRWKKAINPGYEPTPGGCNALKKTDKFLSSYAVLKREGAGENAACGDRIWIRITPFVLPYGERGTPYEAEIALLTQPGLDALLIGIRPNETRMIFLNLPGDYGYLSMEPGFHAFEVTRLDRPSTDIGVMPEPAQEPEKGSSPAEPSTRDGSRTPKEAQ